MTRRRTRSANCAISEMEHVGSFYICSMCKVLLLPSTSDGSGSAMQAEIKGCELLIRTLDVSFKDVTLNHENGEGTVK